MTRVPRIASAALVVVAVAVGIVDVSIYGVAVTSLLGGTSAAGFDSLAFANHLALAVASLAALAVIVRTIGAKKVTVQAFALLLASGVTALIAGGLYAIGESLFSVSNESVRDNVAGAVPGAPMLQLNSLLSGVMGSGYDLAPVPVALAVGGLLVWATAGLRRWKIATRTVNAGTRVEVASTGATA